MYAATYLHIAIVINISKVSAAVVIAAFAIFLNTFIYPFLASLLGCLVVGVVDALRTSATLADVNVVALLYLAVLGADVVQYADARLWRFSDVLILVAMHLASIVEAVGRMVCAVAILTTLAVEPPLRIVCYPSVLGASGGDFGR